MRPKTVALPNPCCATHLGAARAEPARHHLTCMSMICQIVVTCKFRGEVIGLSTVDPSEILVAASGIAGRTRPRDGLNIILADETNRRELWQVGIVMQTRRRLSPGQLVFRINHNGDRRSHCEGQPRRASASLILTSGMGAIGSRTSSVYARPRRRAILFQEGSRSQAPAPT